MRRAVLTTFAALVALVALHDFWRQHKTAAGLDFYIYFVAGQLAGRADVENIYSAETQERIGEEYFERAVRSGSPIRRYDATRRRRLDNVSSPFLYSTMRWFSRDYDRALLQYKVFVLCLFLAAVLLLCRRAKLPWWASLLFLAGLLFVYRGFEGDLRVGNVNSVQLFALAVALWSPPMVAGAVMGMLIAYKPNLLFVIVLLAFAHDRKRLTREVIGGAIGGLLAFVIASISYGPRAWVQWITAANQFWHRLPTRFERNVTPFLEVYQQHGEWIGYVLAAVLAAIVMFVLRRGKDHDHDDMLVVGLGILIYLITATVVWLHYMVLVMPVAIALLRHRVTAVISVLALIVIGEETYELITKLPVFPNDAKFIGPALVVLFAAGVWRLHARPLAAR